MAMYKSATLDYVTYSKHTDWNICHPIMILSSFVFAAYRRTPVGLLNPTVTKPLFQTLLIKLTLGQVNKQAGIYVHTIYINHRVRNLVHKHKTINLTRWEKDPLQSTSKSAEQTKKNKTMIVSKITVLVFWSFSKGMGRTIWFSNRNFRFSQCKW